MKNIKIQEVGDINFDFSYLEIFLKDSDMPFLDIGISSEKELSFTLYASKTDVLLSMEDWEYIFTSAKAFLPKALKNEQDFLDFSD